MGEGINAKRPTDILLIGASKGKGQRITYCGWLIGDTSVIRSQTSQCKQVLARKILSSCQGPYHVTGAPSKKTMQDGYGGMSCAAQYSIDGESVSTSHNWSAL